MSDLAAADADTAADRDELARLSAIVSHVFHNCERLTHGQVIRKRIWYNGHRKSIRRFWASWKQRYAVLTPGVLRLFPPSAQELDFGRCEEYPLQYASVHPHHYAPEGYCLVLFISSNTFKQEITMAFKTQEARETWEKAFNTERVISEAEANQSRERALLAFREFFALRQKLVQEQEMPNQFNLASLTDEIVTRAPDFLSQTSEDYILCYHRALLSLNNWISEDNNFPNVGRQDTLLCQDCSTPSVPPTTASFDGLTAAGQTLKEQTFPHVLSVSFIALPRKSSPAHKRLSRSLNDLRFDSRSSHRESFLENFETSPDTVKNLEKSETFDDSKFSEHIERIPNTTVTVDRSIKSTPDTIPPKLEIPKLNIVIMVVGTRGDLAPFLLLGRRLQCDGHRVRIATHASYRDSVTTVGMEFYPIGGDPVKLSQFMVKTHGWIMPTNLELLREVPENVNMVHEIIHSCWPACTQPDPEDTDERPFVAGAIISNPVAYGHIHCAEALGIPLHIMFPQPWVPTKAFPHPLACLSYELEWSVTNYVSYELVDRLMWLSIEPSINALRRQLGLEPLRHGESGWNLLNANKVPFSCMFSPSLVSRPKDWEQHVDIVGSFFEDNLDVSVSRHSEQSQCKLGCENVASSCQYCPPESVSDWLLKGEKPIFVGFGSMVIENKYDLLRTIVQASALSSTRVIIQSGWSAFTEDDLISVVAEVEYERRKTEKTPLSTQFVDINSQMPISFEEQKRVAATFSPDTSSSLGSGGSFTLTSISNTQSNWTPDDVLLLGPCPHEWLFEQVCGVVHHGGAGTTAAGLRAGKPTMVCPFFGDQPFWGETVYRKGVAAKPCPVASLTSDRLADAFRKMQSEPVQCAARSLAQQLRKENGVEAAVKSFYEHLPTRAMLCDVSLFLGNSVLADEYCATCCLKFCKRVSDVVHLHTSKHVRLPCCYVPWALGAQPPAQVWEGLLQGVGAATHEIVAGLSEAITTPLHGKGLSDSVRALWHGLVLRPSVAGMYLMKKVYAGYLGTKHGTKYRVHRTMDTVQVQNCVSDTDAATPVMTPAGRLPDFKIGKQVAYVPSNAPHLPPLRVDVPIDKYSDAQDETDTYVDIAGEYEVIRTASPTVLESEPQSTSWAGSGSIIARTVYSSIRGGASLIGRVVRSYSSSTTTMSEECNSKRTEESSSSANIGPASLTNSGPEAPNLEHLQGPQELEDHQSEHEHGWLEVVNSLMTSMPEEEEQSILDAFARTQACLDTMNSLVRGLQNQTSKTRFIAVDQLSDTLRQSGLHMNAGVGSRRRADHVGTGVERTECSSLGALLPFQMLLGFAAVCPALERPERTVAAQSCSEGEGLEEEEDEEAASARLLALQIVEALGGDATDPDPCVDFVDFARWYMTLETVQRDVDNDV